MAPCLHLHMISMACQAAHAASMSVGMIAEPSIVFPDDAEPDAAMQAGDRPQQARNLLGSIVDGIANATDDPMAVISLDYTLIAANQAYINGFRMLYGVHLEPGESMVARFDSDSETYEEFRQTLDRAAAGERFTLIRLVPTPEGGFTHLDLTCSPILDASGRQIAIAQVARDVTARVRAELSLSQSEEKYRLVVETAHEGVVITDADWRLTFVNHRFAEMLGTQVEILIGRRLLDIVDDADRGIVLEQMALRRKGYSDQYDIRLRRANGGVVWAMLSMSPMVDVNGHFSGALGMAVDLTDRKQAEIALAESEDRFQRVFDQSPIGSAVVGIDGRYIRANSELCRITGYTEAEMKGLTVEDVTAPEDLPNASRLRRQLTEGELDSYRVELRYLRKSGATVWVRLHVRMATNSDGQSLYMIQTVEDITEKKEYQERLDHLAYHDQLTGLPNRALFSDRLAQRLSIAHRRQDPVAVMFLDLDRFKVINDTLGHEVGDILLGQVAERLQSAVRDADTLSRIGGDEFTVLLGSIAGVSEAEAVARRILRTLADPFTIHGHEIFIGASIGVSVYPQDGKDAQTLLRNADTAMYWAKENGRNNYCIFTESLNDGAAESLHLRNGLRKALDRNEMLIYFQPRVSLDSGRILGAEALLRWQHSEMGLLTPDRFLDIAEETGLIVPINEWALRQACLAGKRWQDSGLPIGVTVNVSSRVFRHDGFVESIHRAIDESGINPQRVTLELKESTVMQDPDLSLTIMQGLRNAGVRISIDNFGTGFSSLSYLKRYPIDSLKIDRSFVCEITSNVEDVALTRMVIAMAHSLRLRVVAEGVESAEQMHALRRLRCDEIQGYLISPPIPSEVFEARLCGDDHTPGSPPFSLSA